MNGRVGQKRLAQDIRETHDASVHVLCILPRINFYASTHTHTHTHTCARARKDSTHTVSSFLFFMSILVYALKTGPYHRPIYLLLFSHQVMSNFVTPQTATC